MPESEQGTRRNHLLVFLLFAGLTLLMTWPVAARMGSYLAGGRDDLWVHQWTFWWVREALRQGLNPFFTPYLYAPAGAALTSHNIAWFNIALWLPLQALFGRIPAYNAVFLISISLNGFCMYLFAWQVLKSYGAALVSGIIFGFWPYTLSHYDHANMMVVFWVPLTLLLIQHLIQRAEKEQGKFHWWLVFGTAISLGMIGITRWQLLIMSSPILAAYSLYLLWETPGARNRTAILELLAAAVLAIVIMAPLATPLVIDQFTREFPEDVFLDEAVWGRTDLLAYFVPSINNGIWHDRVAAIYENFVVNQFYTPFLGFLTLLLALVGAIRRWRQTWIWLALALLYFLLALGPELAINGRAYPAVPMPYRLVEDFFFMRLIRRPDRLNLFLSLPLAMAAGWGMQSLLAGLSRRAWRIVLTGGVSMLLLLAYLPVPYATTKPETPKWFSSLEAGEYAILDLPVNNRSYDKWYMEYQTDHGIPLATGHVSRLPRESTGFLDSVPLLANIEENDQMPDPAITDVGGQLRMLANGGIRYMILHKQFANEGLQAVWRDWLAIQPLYEDDDLLVYNTTLKAGEDFNFEQDLTREIGLVRAQYDPNETIQDGVIHVDAVWGTTAEPPADLDVCLSLEKNDSAAKVGCQPLDARVGTASWPANDVRHASYMLATDAQTEPGEYNLMLYLSDTRSGELVGETAVLGSVTVHPFAPQLETDVLWENGIHLLGMDLAEENDNLTVTLYWQADEPVDRSYKVFVHLQDAQSSEIRVQSDAVPRGWSYPTTRWQPGEIVRDVVDLPLDNVPQGSYQINVGLYEEQSGERLPLASAESSGQQDVYHLTTWEH
ncbi:MAG: hypothetical protein ACK2UR_03180 [Candidatus Promineifilaceae bacterium]